MCTNISHTFFLFSLCFLYVLYCVKLNNITLGKKIASHYCQLFSLLFYLSLLFFLMFQYLFFYISFVIYMYVCVCVCLLDLFCFFGLHLYCFLRFGYNKFSPSLAVLGLNRDTLSVLEIYTVSLTLTNSGGSFSE